MMVSLDGGLEQMYLIETQENSITQMYLIT